MIRSFFLGSIAALCLHPRRWRTRPMFWARSRTGPPIRPAAATARPAMPCPRPAPPNPRIAKRGAIFLMVSDWPGRKVKAEPEIVPGYAYKPGAVTTLGIGGDRFNFFSRNDGTNGSAWLQNLNDTGPLARCHEPWRLGRGDRDLGARHQDRGHLFPGGLRRCARQDSRRLQYVMPAPKTSLIGLDAGAMAAALIAAGFAEKSAKMRVRQLWNWIYVHGARDFAVMTNLAKDFRAEMDAHFTLDRGPKSSPNRFPATAPANGCCAPGRGSNSRPSISPKPSAARSAFPARSAAR